MNRPAILLFLALALASLYATGAHYRARLALIHTRAIDAATLARWQVESPSQDFAEDTAATVAELVELSR